MKTNIIEIIKILVGILLGTAFVMFIIWFMAGGVMFIHPLIVIPILIVLFMLSIIVAGITKGYKLIIVVVGSFIFGWFGFNAYYKHACGPNSADVKVMKPMAQKISDYIVKNEIPESLKDIPDLPYGLVGCERNVELGSRKESCLFSTKDRLIKVYFDYGKYTIDNISHEEAQLEMRHVVNNTTETGLLAYFKKKNSSFVLEKDMKLYSGKTSGICNPMKQ